VRSGRRCAFLTMADTSGWSIDADLAIPPLEALGWTVDTLPWREPRDWSQYDAVYVGTPWDYPEDPKAFLDTLAGIERAGAVLANPLALLRWNLEKTYLRDLESRGAAIVPTEWHDRLDRETIAALGRRSEREPLVVKPTVSTNATDTFVLDGPPTDAVRERIARAFANRGAMVQPFMESIRDEGEYSLFHIGGELSHAIRKRPAAGDFRVQEEHGASITKHVPDAALREAVEGVLALVEPVPLYARSDFVRDAEGRYRLMELELIEPSLYLRMDPAAPERFARAFDAYVTRTKTHR